jgi:hypothetical protein
VQWTWRNFGLTMSKLTGTDWPELSTAYTDEFGRIEPDVYEAAGALWKTRAERFALSTLADAPTGLRLMLKAVAVVSRKYAEPGNLIANLSAYLYQTYKHLVLAELKKENGHRQRATERETELESLSVSLAEDVVRKILVEQIMRQMDDWMREVFELLVLGHTFEEIGRLRDQNGHALGNKFNKHLKRLMKQIPRDK